MADFKIRIVANACIARYDRGETPIQGVVAGYNLAADDEPLVWAHIYSRRPELDEPQAETPAAQ